MLENSVKIARTATIQACLSMLFFMLLIVSCTRKIGKDGIVFRERISQKMASEYIARYKGDSIRVKGFSLSDDIINELNRNSDWNFKTKGFQNYYGLDLKGNVYFLAVPLDREGREIKDEDDSNLILKLFLEKLGRPCPYACDIESAVTNNPAEPEKPK